MSEKLNFSIGVDLSDLSKGLEKASSSIKSFADKNKESFDKVGKGIVDVGVKFSALSAGIIAGVGALGLLAKNVGNVADRLLDLSDITGMTTDAIQEWQYVAKIAGVSTETVTNATEGLVRRLKDVGEEGSPAVKVLQGLGIASKDATGQIRNAGDIVDETIMKLASLENVTERNTLGSQLFGGAWKDIAPILSLGGDGITQLREEAQSLGLVMSNEALQSANEFRQATEKLSAKFEALKNNIGAKLAPLLTNTLLPLIDKYIIPAMEKFVSVIGSVIDWFQQLSPTVKQVILIVGGLVVALGPLLVAIGGFVQFLPILLKGLAVLTGPIGLIVAGITLLTIAIVKNWDTVKRWAQNVVNYFIKLYNESMLFRIGIEAVILVFKNLFAAVKFVFTSIYNIVTTVFKNIYEALKGVANLILSVLTFDLAGIKDALSKTFNSVTKNTSDLFKEITNDAKALFNNIAENRSKAIENVLTRKLENVDFSTKPEATQKLQEAVETAVSNGVANGLSGEGGRRQIKPMQSGMTAASPVMGQIAAEPLLAFRQSLSEEFIRIQNLLIDFEVATNELIFGSITETFGALGDAIGNALATGGDVFSAIGNTLLKAFAGFLSEMGTLLIQYGAAAKIKGKLDLAIAKGGPTAIAAGGAAIAIGIALKAISSAIGSASSGGFSGSGGGGASNSTASSGSTFSQSVSANRDNEVVFRIAGTDLLGVLRRAENQANRIG